MRRILYSTVALILTIGLSIGAIGCGEDEENTARILDTKPNNGGWILTNGSLTITFDKAVTEVKINGTPAQVDDTEATWNAQGLEAGKQTMIIEWTDENGNTDSDEITLNVQRAEIIVCFRPL